MSEPSPMFVDLDPETGRATPTTYNSMRAAYAAACPVSEDVPAEIRKHLDEAVSVFALAYGEANRGNDVLYNRLTDDAFLSGMRALELALRDRLGSPASVPLATLIRDGMWRGLLPGGEDHALFWRMLRENRNTLTHGEGERHAGGMFLGQAIEILILTVNRLYEPVAGRSVSG